MKFINYINQSIFAIGILAGIIACSPESGMYTSPVLPSEGLPIAISLQSKNRASTPSLDYSVYIFSHTTDNPAESYTLDTLISPIEAGSKLKFSNDELLQNNYRFLFIATPAGKKESVIVISGSSIQPGPGTPWENIRLISEEPSLSADNYFQVKDLNGKDILATDTIHGNLTRLVGQMLFNFSKVDPTNTPQPIDPAVTSIFDRIDTIQISYTHYTSQLSFNGAGALIPADTIPDPLIQNIYLTLDNRMCTPIPQAQADTLPGGIQAGGQLKGLCFYPAINILRTSLVFHYYDTTPVCGNLEHAHDKNCYLRKKLKLQLPPANTSSYISIDPDTYTVNKAGILCNRIIDIGVSGNIDLNTQWNTTY